MNIPYFDLKRQHDHIKKEIKNAIDRVVERQFFILGEEAENFEKEFSEYLQCKYSVGVNSGTDGLILALKAIGIGKDDEVIMPTYSFIATGLGASWIGAKPVFVDSDPLTFNIDPNLIEEKITARTKALVVVHIGGSPCDMKKIMQVAKKHNLKVVEDACQAHGSEYNKRKTGTFGDLGVFSFYPSKNLGAYGDAGMVSTSNQEYYERLKMLRNYGQEKKYHHVTEGVNSRMDEIQAAILREKLNFLDEWNLKRNKIARIYKKELSGKFQCQEIYKNSYSNYYLFIILSSRRDELLSYLNSNNIGTIIHYPVPMHLQKTYGYLGGKVGDYPVAEKICNECLSLPLYPELTDTEVEYIVGKLKKF